MNEKKDIPTEIETYVYHKEVINKVISMLRFLKAEGFEQAQLLGEIGKLICSPVKEGTETIE